MRRDKLAEKLFKNKGKNTIAKYGIEISATSIDIAILMEVKTLMVNYTT